MSVEGDGKRSRSHELPSGELTYPLMVGMFEDDVPFPQVGYVNFLEGIYCAFSYFWYCNLQRMEHMQIGLSNISVMGSDELSE